MAPGDLYSFGPFALDARAKRLTRDGEPVALSGRQFDLLHLLVARAGEVLSKDRLIEAAWPDVAVTDNSLEQAISLLRRTLTPPAGQPYIETQARRGYRFAAEVTRLERRESDEDLEALLAPHRAFVDGRAALESLERTQIVRARAVFNAVLAGTPTQAAAHIGLANACVMQFEMTRSELAPDLGALAEALTHAREACRLDAQYGEAWATLGFVLQRSGRSLDALAASRRAIALEPDNWRHHLRLGYVSWGEERLRAARRTLGLLPGFPLAHFLAASVHVARQALDEAERELRTGIAAQESAPASRFSGVALHWLLGLLRLSAGDAAEARTCFERELAQEASGHLYARECCANTWYALGALAIREGRAAVAQQAFDEALGRNPEHVLARVARAAITGAADDVAAPSSSDRLAAERALGRALRLLMDDGPVAGTRAAAAIDEMLSEAPTGSAAWWLPLEPMLQPLAHPDVWGPVLARLRNRAA